MKRRIACIYPFLDHLSPSLSSPTLLLDAIVVRPFVACCALLSGALGPDWDDLRR